MYCYTRCGTCAKARTWLKDRGVDYTEQDLVADTPDTETLEELFRISGKEVRKFFNTSGMKYREMNLKEKLPRMSEEEALKLLASEGMLIKRPVITDGKKVLVGFRPEEWEENVR